VVLAYLDPKIQGHTANILSGLSPYLHVQLKASFLLFSPKIGMLVGMSQHPISLGGFATLVQAALW